MYWFVNEALSREIKRVITKKKPLFVSKTRFYVESDALEPQDWLNKKKERSNIERKYSRNEDTKLNS